MEAQKEPHTGHRTPLPGEAPSAPNVAARWRNTDPAIPNRHHGPRRSRPNVRHGSHDRLGRRTRDLALGLPSRVRRSHRSSPHPGPSLVPCLPDPFHLLLAFRSPPFHLVFDVLI